MQTSDVESRDLIERGYACHSCKHVLREPVQLACGHRLCQSCRDSQNGLWIKCTQCQEETLKSESYVDRGMKNDMKRLTVQCSLCSWTGLLSNYQEHANVHQSTEHSDGSTTESSASGSTTNRTGVLPYNLPTVIQLTRVISETASCETRSPSDETFEETTQYLVSQDGHTFWKIWNVKSLINGRESCLTSPNFYQSPCGYKLCAQLYLHNGSAVQPSHLSIRLALKPSDFDPILVWPFSYQVIFCLYDVSQQNNHIIRSIQTDTQSATSQRPRADMNIVGDILEFIPLSIIQQNHVDHLINDMIYIKILIRKTPIPLSNLPYVMRIDPAPPVHIQNQLIEEELQNQRM